MGKQRGDPVSQAARRQSLVFYLVGGGAALLLLAAAAARANDISWEAANRVAGYAVFAFLAAYSPAVWLVEAAILNIFLERGYWRCLGYAAVANIVSTGIALLWYYNWGQETGWKMSLVDGPPGRTGALFVRSYLVTVAEETVVVLLMLGKLGNVRTALKSVAAANAVSYALTRAGIAVWLG
jgi:hypothetical protein